MNYEQDRRKDREDPFMDNIAWMSIVCIGLYILIETSGNIERFSKIISRSYNDLTSRTELIEPTTQPQRYNLNSLDKNLNLRGE